MDPDVMFSAAAALRGCEPGSGGSAALHLDPGAPLPELVARLNDFGPQMLSAYATMAGALACQQPGLE